MDNGSLKSIDEEKLDGIAGGYIFDSTELSSRAWPAWEVLDADGNVVARECIREDAEKTAKKLGLSTQKLNWNQVQKLRETGSIE